MYEKRVRVLVTAVLTMLFCFIFIKNDSFGAGLSGNDIGTVSGDVMLEEDGNASFAEATNIKVNSLVNDSLAGGGDKNYYKISLPDRCNISFELNITDLTGKPVISDTSDLEIHVYKNENSEIRRWTLADPDTVKQFSTCDLGLAKGDYYICIKYFNTHWGATNLGYSFKVNYTYSDDWEIETNDNAAGATFIDLNHTYYGNSSKLYEHDYYKFTAPEDGYASVSFSFDSIDDNYTAYYLYIYSGNDTENEMKYWTVSCKSGGYRTANLGISKGSTYYIDVKNNLSTAVDLKYMLSTGFTPATNWEKEINDVTGSANSIQLSKPIFGSSYKHLDKDYYCFELDNPKCVILNFKHAAIGDSNNYWKMTLYRESDNKRIDSWKLAGTNSDFKTDPIVLEKGKYYVLIDVLYAQHHSIMDYSLTVSPSDFGPEPSDPLEAFVTRMYRVVLKREPENGGLEYWVSELRSGNKQGADIARGIYLSTELKNKGLSNEDYVELSYKGIMGRDPDAGGKKYWTDALNAGASYEAIIKGFVESTEFNNLCDKYGIIPGKIETSENRDKNIGITMFVSRLYTQALGREFDLNGLNDWCGRIVNDPSKANILSVSTDGFFHSPEFMNKRLNNEEFVKVCYKTYLGREPEAKGFNDWVNRLNSGVSRDDIMAGFANSPEFANIMAQYGL